MFIGDIMWIIDDTLLARLSHINIYFLRLVYGNGNGKNSRFHAENNLYSLSEYDQSILCLSGCPLFHRILLSCWPTVLRVHISHGLVHDVWFHMSFLKMLSLTTGNLFFRLIVYHNKCTFQKYLPLLYHLSFVWKTFITQIYLVKRTPLQEEIQNTCKYDEAVSLRDIIEIAVFKSIKSGRWKLKWLFINR